MRSASNPSPSSRPEEGKRRAERLPSGVEAAGPEIREGALRRLYHWVLSWADRPGGPAALVGIAAAESFFFPIPPDLLLIPLALGKPRRALRFAFLCTMGSVVGGIIGYGIGSGLYQAVGRPILEFYGLIGQYEELGDLYAQHLILTLGTAGFTPIPYKVFTIAAGAFHVSFAAFVAVSAASRGARFFLIAGLIRLFGPQIRRFIERWFNLLTVLFALLLIGGFLVLSLLL